MVSSRGHAEILYVHVHVRGANKQRHSEKNRRVLRTSGQRATGNSPLQEKQSVTIFTLISNMNLSWKYLFTTRLELLSQFLTCSGWWWPEMGDKCTKVVITLKQFHEIFWFKSRKPDQFSRTQKWCLVHHEGLNFKHCSHEIILLYTIDLVIFVCLVFLRICDFGTFYEV